MQYFILSLIIHISLIALLSVKFDFRNDDPFKEEDVISIDLSTISEINNISSSISKSKDNNTDDAPNIKRNEKSDKKMILEEHPHEDIEAIKPVEVIENKDSNLTADKPGAVLEADKPDAVLDPIKSEAQNKLNKEPFKDSLEEPSKDVTVLDPNMAKIIEKVDEANKKQDENNKSDVLKKVEDIESQAKPVDIGIQEKDIKQPNKKQNEDMKKEVYKLEEVKKLDKIKKKLQDDEMNKLLSEIEKTITPKPANLKTTKNKSSKSDKKGSLKQGKAKNNNLEDDLLKNLEEKSSGLNDKSNKRSAKTGSDNSDTKGTQEYDSDVGLSVTEESHVRKQLEKKYRFQSNGDISEFEARVSIDLSREGRVINYKIIDVKCDNRSLDCASLINNVEGAIKQAAFDELDPKRYELWRHMIINFKPDL